MMVLRLLTHQVFPAGAGVIPQTDTQEQTKPCVSRRRGGDPSGVLGLLGTGLCFPQARG